MGYEMSKPNLRAELEADLKLVSEGRKDKRSVLLHHVQKYKTVFIESVRKAKKLVSQSVGFFSDQPAVHTHTQAECCHISQRWMINIWTVIMTGCW